MNMLRDWNGESNTLIIHMLKRFGIEVEKINLMKYEALTPDSFIWIFNLDSSTPERYCLYAEDYVPSIEHINKMIEQNRSDWNPNDNFSLVEVVDQQEVDVAKQANPESTFKKAPGKPDEFMKYATKSGFDYVFLGRNTNKPKTNQDLSMGNNT